MKHKILLILILISHFTFGQIRYDSIEKCLITKRFPETVLENGEYKNYVQFDLGDYYCYNGKYENNLKFKILRKDTNEIVFADDDSQSDAMIFKPKFFSNSDQSICVIMIEIATEYSWGQQIVVIKNNKILPLGYLDYAVAIDNGNSIADYCDFVCVNDKLILQFQEVPIINWEDEEHIILGKDLKFELTDYDIQRIDK
jgi:hypothetical protein